MNSFVSARYDENGNLVTDPTEITPRISLAQLGVYSDPVYKRDLIQPRTAAGTYTGNGTSQSINLGFRPNLVIVKSNNAQFAVIQNDRTFHRRNDQFLNQSSFGSPFGVIITDTGFSVGNDNRVNENTATIHYFAYCDNFTDNILFANWAGNGVAGREVDSFKGRPLAGLWIKRDSAAASVYVAADALQNFFFNGSANAVSTGTVLDGATGKLTLGSGNEVNQWSGILGEGTNCVAIPKDSEAATVIRWTGNATARRIVLPWETEFFFIVPRDVSTATSRGWFSSLTAGQSLPLTNVGVGVGDFTVSGSVVTLGTGFGNLNNIEYVMFAFRKMRRSAIVEPLLYETKHKKSVELALNGFVDCGTSDTLAVNGDLTMEWYGAVYCPDLVQYTASATIDTDAGNQDKLNPLIFRSNGLDLARNSVNYGMAVAAPQVSTDTDLVGAVLLIATHDTWGLLQSTSGNLDNNPMNTGIVLDVNRLYHIVATHQGAGIWKVYVDGQEVKERKRDLLASIGRPNVGSFPNQRFVIGARQRDTIANANGQNFRLARIYNRALTKAEVLNNYMSLFNKATALTTGLVEEWDANKASGSVLPATVNSANNGTITGGIVLGQV